MATSGVRWVVMMAAVVAGCSPAPRARHPPRLVQFGWDEPDPAFLRAHLPAMQWLPFDGVVFHVPWSDGASGGGNTAWQGWGTHALGAEELEGARRDLRDLPWGHLQHSFLRVNLAPGLDWFDDWQAVLGNVEQLARMAREAGIDGLLLDVESYEAPMFDYGRQGRRAERPFGQYAGQARRRGREVMRAVRRGFPHGVVLLTFGDSLTWSQSDQGKKPFGDGPYGLLPAFVDGLVKEAEPGQVVDGYELSYGYREAARFTEARETIRSGVLPLTGDPAQYARTVRAGFGLWLDYEWRQNGWHPDHPEQNYFTPAQLEAALTAALRTTDGYVWLYAETPRWLTPGGQPDALPSPYVDAVRRARAAAGLPEVAEGTRPIVTAPP